MEFSEEKQKESYLKGVHDLYFDRIKLDFDKSPVKEHNSIEISGGVN